MTPEEYFEKWWVSKELPESGFNKTAMLDFAEQYAAQQSGAGVKLPDMDIAQLFHAFTKTNPAELNKFERELQMWSYDDIEGFFEFVISQPHHINPQPANKTNSHE